MSSDELSFAFPRIAAEAGPPAAITAPKAAPARLPHGRREANSHSARPAQGGWGRRLFTRPRPASLPAALAHLEQHALGERRVGIDRIGAQVAQDEK